LRIAVVSPFVDRRHGTERALAELLERLAHDYYCEIHLYAQRVEDLDVRKSIPALRPAQSAGIFWHKVPQIPGPHVVQFLAWMFFNGFLRRWHGVFGHAAYDLVLSPGINCLHPDVVIVHALFHRLRELSRQQNGDLTAETGLFRRAHRRIYYGLLTALERRIYSDTEISLAAVSPRMGRLLKQYFRREDVCIVPNGVDTNHFSSPRRFALRAAARQRREFRDADLVLLLIGNDWRNKGLPAVLEAVAALPGLPLRLLVVGNDAAAPFRALAAKLGVQDRCHWESPASDVLDFYAAADIYVSPSLEDSFGLPVAEGMACGLSVITSVNAGVSDLIRDGADGFVLREPHDAGALAHLLQLLHADPEMRRSVGEAAAKTAEQWDWNRNAAAVWELLKNVAARKASSR
jgi:glycosyltransferase involved in cell wall biosynthesis